MYRVRNTSRNSSCVLSEMPSAERETRSRSSSTRIEITCEKSPASLGKRADGDARGLSARASRRAGVAPQREESEARDGAREPEEVQHVCEEIVGRLVVAHKLRVWIRGYLDLA